MAVIREFKIDYTQIPNVILNNNQLSLKAKGLWCYLVSKPANWNYSVKGVKSQTKEGTDAITSGLKELEKERLLKRVPKKDKDGKFIGYDYFLYDKPFTENPIMGKSNNGEHPNHSNTDLSNKELSNTKEDTPKKNSGNTPTLFGESINPNKKTLFENSAFFEISIFKNKLKEVEALGVDLEHYHRAMNNWSTSKNQKRTAKGWIATARTWMESDKEKKCLRMVQTEEQVDETDAQMSEYLNT